MTFEGSLFALALFRVKTRIRPFWILNVENFKETYRIHNYALVWFTILNSFKLLYVKVWGTNVIKRGDVWGVWILVQAYCYHHPVPISTSRINTYSSVTQNETVFLLSSILSKQTSCSPVNCSEPLGRKEGFYFYLISTLNTRKHITEWIITEGDSVQMRGVKRLSRNEKNRKTQVPSPVHSAASWGCCSRHGAPRGPEWRTAPWREVGAGATWKKAVGEAGTRSCGRSAAFGPL